MYFKIKQVYITLVIVEDYTKMDGQQNTSKNVEIDEIH